jgi:hypothetical protein
LGTAIQPLAEAFVQLLRELRFSPDLPQYLVAAVYVSPPVKELPGDYSAAATDNGSGRCRVDARM